jgi:AbrB family looped-hinge helix DNA binding protein
MVKLDEAKVTSQGQMSIPKKVRERMHLRKGTRIAFIEDERGRIFIEEAEAPIEFSKEAWEEFLDKTQKEPVTRLKGRAAALRHLDSLSQK